jgi:hypothetical protein
LGLVQGCLPVHDGDRSTGFALLLSPEAVAQSRLATSEPRGNTETFTCPQDRAFRYLAVPEHGTASEALGAALKAAGQMPPGDNKRASGTQGFAAHHIVAGGATIRHAPTSQALAYACEIEPNEFRNGIWLRGFDLHKKGEGPRKKRYTQDSDGYNELDNSDGRSRAYHPTIHSTRYFDNVARDLSGCTSALARSKLAIIKGLLRVNQYDFGQPATPLPPGQD